MIPSNKSLLEVC